MSSKNCTVCGLNEKACLHSLEFNYKKRDERVARLFWLAIGILFGVAGLLIEIVIL